MKKAKCLLVLGLIVISTLLSGCWDALPVERRAFVTSLGVDWLPEAPHLNVTIVHPLMEERRMRENRVLTIRAHSVSEALTLWNHTNGQHLSLAVLGVLVIGEAAAKQPLSPVLNDLCAHPDFRLGAHVIVTRGTAQALLSVQPPAHQLISVHLRSLLDRAIFRRDAPRTTVSAFITHMMMPGMDAMTALVSPIGTLDRRQAEKEAEAAAPNGQQAGGGGGGGAGAGGGGNGGETAPRPPQEDVQVVGAAIWQGDKVVETLTLPEAQFVYLAMGKANRLMVNVMFPPDERLFPKQSAMVLSMESVTANWSLEMVQEVPHYTLRLQVRLSLHNYAGDVDLSKKDNSALLEKMIGDVLRQNTLQAVQKVAATGGDPLRLGQLMRRQYPELWNSKEWRNKIQTAQFTVKAEAQIRNIGLELLRLEPVDK
ncbi:MAG: Ger(x)C family spore germination protein [Selenomonadales bacterium]|nr:Ger(x)C family spore germination protein [Selenomonadales bacterium]